MKRETNFQNYLRYFIVALVLVTGSCTTDHDVFSPEEELTAVNASASNYPGAVKASSFGFNSTNATAAFQKAINSNHSTIIIDKKSSNWNIGPVIFRNLSNKTIVFEDGVVVKALRGKFPSNSDCLIRFMDSRNIRLEGKNAILEGNKGQYSGYGRHILNFQGCTNMYVDGFSIRNSGGDGIYVAKSNNKTFSENINISNVKVTNSTRLGIGVISAQDLTVTNSEFSTSRGMLPETGVTLEPNKSYERLVNITFRNCRFTHNANAGIKVSLQNLTSSSLPISVIFKNCYLTRNGTPGGAVDTEIDIIGSRRNPVKGDVLFEDLLVENSDYGLLHAAKLERAFHVTFRDVVARNINRSNSMPAMKIRVQDKSISDPVGGLTLENVFLEYEGNQPYFCAQGSWAMNGFRNISGDITVKSTTQKRMKLMNVDLRENVNVDVDHRWIRK